LLDKYQEVFKGGFGTITPYMASVHVKEGTQSKFHKARPVPYAQKERVGQELDWLENLGVLEKHLSVSGRHLSL